MLLYHMSTWFGKSESSFFMQNGKKIPLCAGASERTGGAISGYQTGSVTDAFFPRHSASITQTGSAGSA